MRQRWAIGLLAAVWSVSTAVAGEYDLGPIAAHFPSIEGHEDTRLLGPVYQRIETDNGRSFTAVRPVWSHTDDPSDALKRTEVLWPVYTRRSFRNEDYWRFLIAYGQRFNETGDDRYRLWLLPFFFMGRDKQDREYAALFPLGGSIHEFLFQDTIDFVLFPLWSQSRVNDVKTTCVLWPIYAHTQGEGIEKRRVFPLYGYADKEDEYFKHFVLWPIWTHARYTYPKSSGYSFILFPLFGRTKLTDQRGWSVLPPIFRYSESEERTVLYAPWPFVQRMTGDVDKLYLWPVWGRKTQGHTKHQFVLWPVFMRWAQERPQERNRQFRVTPIYHEAVSRERDPAGQGALRYRYYQVWPLFDYRSTPRDSRFRLLSLWPMRDHGPIERNWAPIWRLFEYRTHEEGAYAELLWGLYRYRRYDGDSLRGQLFPFYQWRKDVETDRREWALLKGLLGCKKEGSAKTWRLLWLLKWKTGYTMEEE